MISIGRQAVAEPLEVEHLADGEYADGPGAASRGEGGTRAVCG